MLERKKIGKDFAWILKPKKKIESKWFASLNKYSKDKDNTMESIRASIGKSLGNLKSKYSASTPYSPILACSHSN